MKKILKALRLNLRELKNNQSGFTFVELLVVIVIMAVLVAGTANFLFGQGGAKARDVERKNDMKQVAALLEQFNTSYGEPPNSSLKNRKLKDRTQECASVNGYEELLLCFKALKYIEGEGVMSLAEDPKQGIANEAENIYMYKYGGSGSVWKICALLENQNDPDLNDNYAGSGEYGEEGSRTYCLVSTNRKLSDMTQIEGTEDYSSSPLLEE